MRSVFSRLAWAGVLGGWGFGAQAVLFDPLTAGFTNPMAVTATSTFGAITVNANGIYPGMGTLTPDVLRGSLLSIGTPGFRRTGLLATNVQAVDGGIVFTPAVSGSLAASYTKPVFVFDDAPIVSADADIWVRTDWTDPATTGLAVTVSGLSRYLGDASPNGVGSYGVKYKLTLNATSTTGQSLSLLSVQSPQQIQESFAYTALVPAGFDLASLSASLTAAFSSSGGAPYAFNYRGLSTSYKVSIDNITLTPVAIPEPATWALMGLGLVGVAAVARGRRQA